jgi:hypothetical protein
MLPFSKPPMCPGLLGCFLFPQDFWDASFFQDFSSFFQDFWDASFFLLPFSFPSFFLPFSSVAGWQLAVASGCRKVERWLGPNGGGILRVAGAAFRSRSATIVGRIDG